MKIKFQEKKKTDSREKRSNVEPRFFKNLSRNGHMVQDTTGLESGN